MHIPSRAVFAEVFGRCDKTNLTFHHQPDPISGSIDPYRALLDRVNPLISLSETRKAMDELQKRLGGELNRYIWRRFASQGEDFVEELTQETWKIVMEKATQCRGTNKTVILAWIKTIALHTGLEFAADRDVFDRMLYLNDPISPDGDERSNEETFDPALDQCGDPRATFRSPEDTVVLHTQMQSLFKRLSDREKKVFLYIYEGYSKTEVAQKMRISKPRVCQILQNIGLKLNAVMA